MQILQVSTADKAGGAEAVAWQLFQAYRRLGHCSWLAVGRKHTEDSNVLIIPNDSYRSGWARAWVAMGNLLSPFAGKVRGAGRMRRLLQIEIGQPRRWLDFWQGREDFDFPATRQLLSLTPEQPDIVHCHNLHGLWPRTVYFDLTLLPWLSQQVPVVLTLHDAWLLSGHCAHSFDCERWKIGCGHCPDLTILPAIRRDATAYNWRRKQETYAKSRLYVTTPSRWLMQKVEQSMLAPAIAKAQVIPNGVDRSIFHPADKQTARSILGIPQDDGLLLFAANTIRRNVWKDYNTMRDAIALIAERFRGRRVLFTALGEDAPTERIGQTEVRFVPYQKDPKTVARYYQAADIYVHAAKADTFPCTVLEALACGTPVVATATGGIPEQVKGVPVVNGELNGYGADEATGVLVPMGDAKGMADTIGALLTNDMLRIRLGENATIDAQRRFDLGRQVDAYLEIYTYATGDWRKAQTVTSQA